MLKKILNFLVIILFFQTQNVHAYNMPALAVDLSNLAQLAESGALTEDQYNEAMAIQESGGDVLLNQEIIPRDEQAVTDYQAWLTKRAESLKNGTLKNIGGDAGVQEVQDHSMEKIVGHGNWAFKFIFIDKKGNEKVISSYNANTAVRPGSTMKLFTAWAALKRGTYIVGNNPDQAGTMIHMMRWSSNIEADAALRSVAIANPDFQVPADSYVHSLLGYKMKNNGVYLTIDKNIIKGVSILRNAYSVLDDFSKFHQVNGSGLQDSDRDEPVHINTVTPQLEIALLKRILISGKYDQFKKLLPSPGKRGTLQTYFNSSEFPVLRKNSVIYAKTGTLSGAKALAGYAEIPQGKIVFSIISDNLRGLTPDEALAGPIESIVAKNINFVIAHAK